MNDFPAFESLKCWFRIYIRQPCKLLSLVYVEQPCTVISLFLSLSPSISLSFSLFLSPTLSFVLSALAILKPDQFQELSISSHKLSLQYFTQSYLSSFDDAQGLSRPSDNPTGGVERLFLPSVWNASGKKCCTETHLSHCDLDQGWLGSVKELMHLLNAQILSADDNGIDLYIGLRNCKAVSFGYLLADLITR